ncbi:MAG: valine--tRNA ligase [Gammaproteobacteria bacterium]|nr:valine--tRNA ligase [Gammaproteobacteria bacterium]
MEKTYNPKYIEQRWSNTWEDEKYFKPTGHGQPYCIVIPPPNVTGTLHMGHGFQHTLMDVLIRYHRMQGDNTLWQVGTDHAGIATQMLVTQQLISKGQDPYQMTREKLVNKIWEWKEHSAGSISQQMRRLGISVDWDRERFTMDKGLSKAVQKVFIDLYREGLIYRGQRLVNWDPILNTAVSDLEVISEETQGSLWYINYPIENGEELLTIATTRPETMLGDAAIAVHPEDERYQHLVGKFALLPLTERRIPIIADEYVDREFGTGCVKITPAHDFNDYAIGKRHDLPMINIMNPNATINDNAPKKYQGLDRFEARKQIVADLKAANLLVKIEPHNLKVPKGDRSSAVIEPLLTDQWFVKANVLAKPAIEAVESGKLKFVPENWSKTYLQWLYNIEDWCISRQLIWGHRIPAWYDENNNIYVGENEEEIRDHYKLNANVSLTQDEDVLDTWFSSALWPFSTLGWPEKTPELKNFYPNNVLVTGFDIIFFWVARMVMMGMKFAGDIPFHEVYITGLIRDPQGQKMSKSKGNVLDPIDLVDGISLKDLITKRTTNLMQADLAEKIEKATKKDFPDGIKAHGMDALRFTFCALASTGRDINFDLNRLDGYRSFCNKLWNASRFVMMNIEPNELKAPSSPGQFGTEPNLGGHPIKACPGLDPGSGDDFGTKLQYSVTESDAWILSRLQQTIKTCHESIANYRFDLLAQTLYEFIWHEYCDWYLELYKVSDKTSNTILIVLETILRLIHPIMPFISEEIWQRVAPLLNIDRPTIMLEQYPVADEQLINKKIEQEINWLQQIIISVRNIRGEMNITPNKKIPLLIKNANKQDQAYLDKYKEIIIKLAKLELIENTPEKLPATATALINQLELHIPLADIIDVAAERGRLEKSINKLKIEIQKSEAKLNNINYINRAPEKIVATEKARLAENQTALAKLTSQFDKL